MMLGKRPRAPMRRTTSVTELILPEIGVLEVPRPPPSLSSDHHQHHLRQPEEGGAAAAAGHEWTRSGYASAVATPRLVGRRDLSGMDTAPFLKACRNCMRRLDTGKDIFMYRGEMAFCSLECRQQQINRDERKDKCSLASTKKPDGGAAASVASVAASGTDESNGGAAAA